jgi:peptidoglycan/LPS O-acetylase OafA/YrhL
MAASSNRIFFPGLYGIRTLAALSVVLNHIEFYKNQFRIPKQDFVLTTFALKGSDAITLFFVLSGFLITYLLLAEWQRTETISVRKFYMRRFLRIWPLYYLLIFVGFVLIPVIVHLIGWQGYYTPIYPDFWPQLWPYLLFVPNIAGFVGANLVVGLEQMWTIGIEEQFYLIWPNLMKQFARRALKLMFGVIIFKLLIIEIDQAIVVNNSIPQAVRYFVSFLTNLRIEAMAIGGIGAFFVFNEKRRVLALIYHPIVEKAVLLLMIGNFVFFDGGDSPINNMWLSALYMLFIVNVATNPKTTVKLTHPVLRYLGRMSFGLYMYHNAVIFLVLVGLSYTNVQELPRLAYNLLLVVTVLLVLIAVSALSYEKFEKPILRLKSRYTVVRSGLPTAPAAAVPSQLETAPRE